jgi:hypothetical protein
MTRQHTETLHTGGWPRIYPSSALWRWRRVIEAWWVLTGKHSLHIAWQNGYDQHIRDESARIARGGQ